MKKSPASTTDTNALREQDASNTAVAADQSNVVLYARKPNPATVTSGHLTLKESFYADVLFAFAQDNIGKVRKHKITTAEFKDEIGYRRNDLKQIRTALENLLTKVISFGVFDMDDPHSEYKASAWLASVRVARGVIEYEYSSVMEELISQWGVSKGYTKFQLKILRQFKSKHAYHLYQICSRYAGVKSTRFYPWEHWQSALHAGNADFKSFYYFNRDVLGPAIEEVNSLSDIHVSPVLKGRGREVKMLVEPNPDFQNPVLPNTRTLPTTAITRPSVVVDNESGSFASYKNYVVDMLEKEFGLSNSQVPAMLEQFRVEGEDSDKYIREFAEYLLDRKKAGKINTPNLAGYAYKTLENYKCTTAMYTKASRSHIEARQIEEAERLQKEEIKEAYAIYVRDRLNRFYDQLSAPDKEKIKNAFVRYLAQFNIIVTRQIIEGIEDKGFKDYPYKLSSFAQSYFVKFCEVDGILDILDKDAFAKQYT